MPHRRPPLSITHTLSLSLCLSHPVLTQRHTTRKRSAQVEGADTILLVKQKFHDKEGLAPALQVLIFAGKELDDALTLNDYRIQREDSLTLVERVLGIDDLVLALAAATSGSEAAAAMEHMDGLCGAGYGGDRMDLLKRVGAAARQAKERLGDGWDTPIMKALGAVMQGIRAGGEPGGEGAFEKKDEQVEAPAAAGGHLTSQNFPDRKWKVVAGGPPNGHLGDEVRIMPPDDGPPSLLKIVDGLTGQEGTVSFEVGYSGNHPTLNGNRPGWFLRNRNDKKPGGSLRCHAKDRNEHGPDGAEDIDYRRDATFYPRPALSGSSEHYSFESVDYPGMFITGRTYICIPSGIVGCVYVVRVGVWCSSTIARRLTLYPSVLYPRRCLSSLKVHTYASVVLPSLSNQARTGPTGMKTPAFTSAKGWVASRPTSSTSSWRQCPASSPCPL